MRERERDREGGRADDRHVLFALLMIYIPFKDYRIRYDRKRTRICYVNGKKKNRVFFL